MTSPAPRCIHLTVSRPPRVVTHHWLAPRSLNFWGRPVRARTMKLLIIRKCWIRWWTSKRTTASPAAACSRRPARAAAGGGRRLRSVAMASWPPEDAAALFGQPAQQLQLDVDDAERQDAGGKDHQEAPREVGGRPAVRRGRFVAERLREAGRGPGVALAAGLRPLGVRPLVGRPHLVRVAVAVGALGRAGVPQFDHRTVDALHVLLQRVFLPLLAGGCPSHVPATPTAGQSVCGGRSWPRWQLAQATSPWAEPAKAFAPTASRVRPRPASC